MAVSPARLAAYRILRAVHQGRCDLPDGLARERRGLVDERDRALAAELATGVLRWRAALDHVVATCARRTVDRLDPEVLDILRIATYQILHLDRIPTAAAVDEAVRMASAVRKRSAGGLINGVLRAIARARSALPLPARPVTAAAPDDEAWLDYLSITWSHPRWLIRRWLRRYGAEATERWTQFNNAPAPLTLRVNTLRIDPAALQAGLAGHGVSTEPARYAPTALTVTAGNPYRTPLAAQGLFVVQDEASQLVTLMMSARPGERMLDSCAAPGGKTTALAADMHDEGLIVAIDRRPKRLALLRETLRATGARAQLVQADIARGVPVAARFDGVLLDAPCSGLGTIRRDPEIRWRRAPEDLARYAAMQERMLACAARAVAPGGRLVYATCSSEPEENDEVVVRFLDEHPDFDRAFPPDNVAAHPGLAAVLDASGQLRTSPHLHGLEAFFAARLERRRGPRDS